MKFGVTTGPVVSEEKSFEIVDERRRTTQPAYTISSHGAFGSSKLKRVIILCTAVVTMVHICFKFHEIPMIG